MELQSYKWKRASKGEIPEGAVIVGKGSDGSPLYAGRATHGSELLPATVSHSFKGAKISHDSREYKNEYYDVLTDTNVAWQPVIDEKIPKMAIIFGHTYTGEKLYMGRTTKHCPLTVGKIHPSHGVVYIPSDGKELSFKDFDALIAI